MIEKPPRTKPYAEMRLVKHAFAAGIPAQQGIEH
jgi:ATP:corrinoid adenosyltransferase